MNLSLIDLIFRKELLEAFRDRKTIVFMFLMPVLLYPLLGIGFFQLALIQVNKMSEVPARVAFQGPAAPPRFLELLQKNGKFEVTSPELPLEDALLRKEIQAVIEFPEGHEETLASGRQIQVHIRYDDADELSVAAYYRLWAALADYEEEIVKGRMADRGLPNEFLDPIAEKAERTATPERRAGYHLGRFLPYLILMMIINGTMYPAIDITAGEKERGTLECLLASPPTSLDIVIAKFATVCFFGLLSTALNLASLGFTAASIFQSVRHQMISEMFVLSISWETILLTGVLLAPFTILFAALIVSIASYADSFKEAQVYIMPLFFVVILPAMVSALPGMELNAFWAVVPVANLCLLMKELFLEQATADQVALVFVCSCAYAAAALSFAVRFFSQEEVLFPREHSFALFRSRIWAGGRLAAELGVSDALMIYALIFPLSYFVGALALGTSPTWSILLQQWGVLAGVPLLLARNSRVDLRQTFLLRAPPSWSLLGTILILAGGMLLVRQYAFFQSQWLPEPKQLERELIGLFREASGGSLAALLFLGALSPAVCEELLFRGFILSGLRSRLSKWQCLILSAALFGALHMVIYQFVPTALLGLLLAWLAWETGSILPGMLFHFLNNAVAFVFLHYADYGKLSAVAEEEMAPVGGWLESLMGAQEGPLPWWVTLLAVAVLALGCRVVRKGRSDA